MQFSASFDYNCTWCPLRVAHYLQHEEICSLERWLNGKRSGRTPTGLISDANSNTVVAQKGAEFHCGSVSARPSRSFIY